MQRPADNHQKGSKENSSLRDSCLLEEEEEWVLQRRAELQELESELRRREEVLLRREACMQQKNKLENKMLRSSQVSMYRCPCVKILFRIWIIEAGS